MKIVVRSSESEHVHLSLPSGLILNPAGAMLLRKLLKKSGIQIEWKQTRLFRKAINQYRRSHPGWKLVEVESADGEYVEISI